MLNEPLYTTTLGTSPRSSLTFEKTRVTDSGSDRSLGMWTWSGVNFTAGAFREERATL